MHIRYTLKYVYEKTENNPVGLCLSCLLPLETDMDKYGL